jgi:hypothetical protein
MPPGPARNPIQGVTPDQGQQFAQGLGKILTPVAGIFDTLANSMSNYTTPAPQPDGAPTDVPSNPGMSMGSMGGGKGGFGGGKGGFGGPSASFGMPPGAAGQGTPTQGGAQFTQNT